MLCELLIVNAFGRILRAEARNGKGLIAAHLLDEPLKRPRALVVEPAFYAVEKLFLLALNIIGKQKPALCAGREQYLAAEVCVFFENSAAVGQVFIVGKAR